MAQENGKKPVRTLEELGQQSMAKLRQQFEKADEEPAYNFDALNDAAMTDKSNGFEPPANDRKSRPASIAQPSGTCP